MAQQPNFLDQQAFGEYTGNTDPSAWNTYRDQYAGATDSETGGAFPTVYSAAQQQYLTDNNLLGDASVNAGGVSPLGGFSNIPIANNSGMPGFPIPEYGNILQGGEDGVPLSLPDEFQLGSQYDGSALNNLSEYANQTGPSPWLTDQFSSIDLMGQEGMDALEQQRLGGLGEAREGLSSRGGLTTGAGERLEESGMLAKMMGMQQQGMTTNKAKLDATQFDREGKLDMLQALPGMQLQEAQYKTGIDQANLGNLMGERDKEFGAEMDKYKTQMGAWAASQQADATAANAGGGGGGCFITTAVCENLGLADDNEILNSFRDLRDNFMKKDEAMLAEVKEYYAIAPKIVELIKEDDEGIFKGILHKYLIPAFKDIKSGKKQEAYESYVNMVNELKEKYIGKE